MVEELLPRQRVLVLELERVVPFVLPSRRRERHAGIGPECAGGVHCAVGWVDGAEFSACTANKSALVGLALFGTAVSRSSARRRAASLLQERSAQQEGANWESHNPDPRVEYVRVCG